MRRLLHRAQGQPGVSAVGCASVPGESGQADWEKMLPVAKTEDSGRGRIEMRTAVVVEAKALAEHHEFLGPTAFGHIEATRVIDGKDRNRRAHLRAVAQAVAESIAGDGS